MERNETSECCCENPDRLNGKPEDCTPEQIRECHGESGEHSCCQPHGEKK